MKYLTLFISAITLSLLFTSCNVEDLNPKKVYQEEISPELTTLLEYVFDPVNSSEIVYIKTCGAKNCFELYKYPSDNFTDGPLLKTRSEAPDSDGWIYWGEVKGVITARSMAAEMEKIYKGRCYELRMAPSGDNRKVYHRPCR